MKPVGRVGATTSGTGYGRSVTVRRSLAVALASTCLALSVSACGDDSVSTSARPAGTAVAAANVYAAHARDAVAAVAGGSARLLDVRTREEWDAGHAASAELLPLARLQAGALPRLPKSTKVFVYCRSGRRAAIAVRILRSAGFDDVTNIGGLEQWRQAGGSLAGGRATG